MTTNTLSVQDWMKDAEFPASYGHAFHVSAHQYGWARRIRDVVSEDFAYDLLLADVRPDIRDGEIVGEHATLLFQREEVWLYKSFRPGGDVVFIDEAPPDKDPTPAR